MYIENYKRDKNNSSIVAVNAESINNHRNTLHQKKLLLDQIEDNKKEISMLREEIFEMRTILSNLINHKS